MLNIKWYSRLYQYADGDLYRWNNFDEGGNGIGAYTSTNRP